MNKMNVFNNSEEEKIKFTTLERLAIKYLGNELTKEYLLDNGYNIDYFYSELKNTYSNKHVEFDINIVYDMMMLLVDLDTIDVETLAKVIDVTGLECCIDRFFELVKDFEGNSEIVENVIEKCIYFKFNDLESESLTTVLNNRCALNSFGILQRLFLNNKIEEEIDYDKYNLLIRAGEKKRLKLDPNKHLIPISPLFYIDYNNCSVSNGFNTYSQILENLSEETRVVIETMLLRSNTIHDLDYSSLLPLLYYIKNYVSIENREQLFDKVLVDFKFNSNMIENMYSSVQNKSAVDLLFLNNWSLFYPYVSELKQRDFLENIVKHYFRRVIVVASKDSDGIPLFRKFLDLAIKYNIYIPANLFEDLSEYPKLLKELDVNILSERDKLLYYYTLKFKNKKYEEYKDLDVHCDIFDLSTVVHVLTTVCFFGDEPELNFAYKLLYNFSQSQRYSVVKKLLENGVFLTSRNYRSIEELRKFGELKYVLNAFYTKIFVCFYDESEIQYLNSLFDTINK